MLRVEGHVAYVHAGIRHGPAHEATHLLFAHAGEHGGLHPQPGGIEGDVGRASADVLAEGLHVFELRPLLLGIEVHAGAPDAHEVKRVVRPPFTPRPLMRRPPPRRFLVSRFPFPVAGGPDATLHRYSSTSIISSQYDSAG